MSGCNGCYNGCVNITSDQCVKYTGTTISSLVITNGDPLSQVVDAITTYLLTVLDGTGIVPDVDDALCTIVEDHLPQQGVITLVDVLKAIIESVCDLETSLDGALTDIETLNDDYDVDCLSGVVDSSDTHDVLQAVIDDLCATIDDVAALESALTGYVPLADINAIIDARIAATASDSMYTKMVPYTAVEYYGPLSGYPTISDGFNINGEGYGAWQYVYLCNGYNGLTPDKKGFIPIGCTNMGGAAFNAKVDPASGNYEYNGPNVVRGVSKVSLTIAEMPIHKHTIDEPEVNDPGHRHVFGGDRTAITPMGFDKYSDTASGYNVNANTGNYGAIPFYTKSSTNQAAQLFQTTGISVSVPDTGYTGSSTAHENIPPVRSCYYIMYVPAT